MFNNYTFYVYGRFHENPLKVFLQNNLKYEKAVEIFKNCLENKDKYFLIELGIKVDNQASNTLCSYFPELPEVCVLEDFRGTHLEGNNEVTFNVVKNLKEVLGND